MFCHLEFFQMHLLDCPEFLMQSIWWSSGARWLSFIRVLQNAS